MSLDKELKEEKQPPLTEVIKKVIDIAKRANLIEVELKDGNRRIYIKRAPCPSIKEVPSFKPQVSHNPDDNYHKVVSSLTGTFYRKPGPDACPYVEVGQIVEEGQIIGLIESMKFFNEVYASIGGRLVKFLKENGEYTKVGEVICLIKPNATST